MSKFKVGDRIVCVRDGGGPKFGVIGRTYTVASIERDDPVLFIDGVRRYCSGGRFRLADGKVQKHPSLTLRAAKEGGFVVTSAFEVRGMCEDIVAAFSTVDEAAEFVRRSLGQKEAA